MGTSILRIRARRFQALHDLLTRAVQAEPRNARTNLNDHLQQDIGLPRQHPEPGVAFGAGLGLALRSKF